MDSPKTRAKNNKYITKTKCHQKKEVLDASSIENFVRVALDKGNKFSLAVSRPLSDHEIVSLLDIKSSTNMKLSITNRQYDSVVEITPIEKVNHPESRMVCGASSCVVQ